MKRKIIALCILAICLTGCEVERKGITEGQVRTDVLGQLVEFELEGALYIYTDYGTIAPYYNKNGKMCHRVDGKVVEIDESN